MYHEAEVDPHFDLLFSYEHKSVYDASDAIRYRSSLSVTDLLFCVLLNLKSESSPAGSAESAAGGPASSAAGEKKAGSC